MTTKKKRGRKPIRLSDKEIEQLGSLAAIGCTNDEISSVIGCSWDTLDRNYAEVIKKGRDTMKASLRRAQFKAALEGNSTMQIWLGKQLLGQKEPDRVWSGRVGAGVESTDPSTPATPLDGELHITLRIGDREIAT